MKIGIGSYAFRWAIGRPDFRPSHPLSPAELLRKAVQLEVVVVQFCENIPMPDPGSHEARELRRAARDARLTLEVGTQAVDRSILEACLRLAVALDARLCRVALNTADHHPSPDESRSIIDGLLPMLRADGITLALENHFHLGSREIRALVEHYHDPHVRVCLDTANSTGLLERPIDTVETLAPYVASLHLKDYAVEKSSVGYQITGRPLGEGQLDTPRVLQLLTRSGCDPTIVLEQWVDRADGEEQTMRREEEWVGRSVRYLKQQLKEGA